MSENDIIKHPEAKEEFDKLISGNKPVLVDFFATWCGPCQMMGPMLDEMVKNYKNIDKVKIAKVDIDLLRDVAAEYGVMSVPTFILFDGGKPVETMVGMRSCDDLTRSLDKLMK